VIKLALLITMIGGVSSDAYDSQRNDNNNHQIIRDENLDPNGNDDDSDEDCGPVAFQLTRDENTNNNKRTNVTSFYEDQSTTVSEQQKTLSKRRNSSSNSAAVKTRRRDMSHLLLVGDPGTVNLNFYVLQQFYVQDLY
jgi:hypothetical protein